MLGELEENEEAQHSLGFPVERRWVYPWEEEDDVPMQYAKQAEIRLSRDREEAVVDKKREDFSWLEEVIERQRIRESYEQEFDSSSYEFALMAETKEEEKGQGSSEADKDASEVHWTEGEGSRAQVEKERSQRQPETEAKAWQTGEGMAEEDAAALKEVLTRFRSAFAYTRKEVGRCKMAEVTIELTMATPVYQRRRRMTPEEIKICTEKCQELMERVIDQVLRNVPNAACYVDDVIVFSTDSKSHVQDVEAVLRAIQEVGLTCHPGKCRFGQRTVEYLGFEVEGGRIGIQQAKVEVRDRVAVPKDKSTLRSLLGFLNYYRKFVPNFSKRAMPLNHLLREDQKWEWGPEQDQDVQDLMGAVKSGAVLELPKAELPFTLYTD
ncbi:unnamed protein product [Closterium sp. NIES-54]